MENNYENQAPVAVADNTAPAGEAEKTGASATGNIAGYLKIIIPLIVVCVCGVVVYYMLQGVIADSNSVHGKFVSNASQDTGAYIIFDRDGSYIQRESENGSELSGSWIMGNNGYTLTESESGKSKTMYYIDSKYIAFDDENFLEGTVPEASLFDAEFVADDGTVYVFGSDGKCYTSEEGRNTELGTYMTDGMFIVITSENIAHTYLNCGDGITSVFFTQA